jgi:hypothetical protein
VDVARFGRDRTTLVKRCTNATLEKHKSWVGQDLMQTSGRIYAEWLDTPPELRPEIVFVDVIGIGAGVADRLMELGLPVSGVNVAEEASVDEKYMRLRDELWFKARKWLEQQELQARRRRSADRRAHAAALRLHVDREAEGRVEGRIEEALPAVAGRGRCVLPHVLAGRRAPRPAATNPTRFLIADHMARGGVPTKPPTFRDARLGRARAQMPWGDEWHKPERRLRVSQVRRARIGGP